LKRANKQFDESAKPLKKWLPVVSNSKHQTSHERATLCWRCLTIKGMYDVRRCDKREATAY